MAPASSCSLEVDNETRTLQNLLDAFGSVFSLEEIASAYVRSNSDPNRAGEILYQLEESKATGVAAAHSGVVSSVEPQEPFYEHHATNSTLSSKNTKGLKSKKSTASGGIVSSVLGKSYARYSPCLHEPSGTMVRSKSEVKQSVIINLDTEPLASDSTTTKENISDKDVEEFLFSMLGDGFKLSMDVIKEVLGNCGYNVKRSMDELLSLSGRSLDKGKGIAGDRTEKFIGTSSTMVSCLCDDNIPAYPSAQRNGTELSTLEKERSKLSREVLEALFVAPERSEEEPKRKRLEWGLNRTRVVGQATVSRPLDDISPVSVDIPKIKVEVVSEDEHDKYHILRRAAKQHWDTMKAYYEAAIDAFNKGDRAQAEYLLEQGRYYNQMAREADENSAGEILETRSDGIQDEITLDLSDQSAKDALQMLKLHLQSLASIPTFRWLKVIVDPNAEVFTKRKRKRLVIKLLEKESITWKEGEGNPGTIIIPLDVIDPSKLSFANPS